MVHGLRFGYSSSTSQSSPKFIKLDQQVVLDQAVRKASVARLEELETVLGVLYDKTAHETLEWALVFGDV